MVWYNILKHILFYSDCKMEVPLMALQVSADELKTNFSKLLARAREGEEVIITKRGKPIARLVPIKEHPLQRIPGSAKGEVIISPDFDAPLPDSILETFEK